MSDSVEPPVCVDLDVDGQQFTLWIHPDPSGLRGQVFDGEEKIAGVQIFHTTEVALLVELARKDRAVLRAVSRRQEATQPC